MKELIIKYKLVIIAIVVLSIVLIGGTYAWINLELFGTKTNRVTAGSLELELDESTCTEINVSNAIPITDEEGMKQVACKFTLENTGTLDISYSVFLDDEELLAGEERMDDNDIKYSLVKNGNNTIKILALTGINPNRIIDSGALLVGNKNTYELRLWIDENASVDAMGKVVATKLRVISEIYNPVKCSELESYDGEANPPELVDGMIPVVYDESSTSWVKADVSNAGNSWYNYDNQMWANAVTVTSANRDTLVNSSVGTVIPMEDINIMVVWVPRYAYTLGNTYGYQGYGGDTPSAATPGAFDIRFTNSDLTCNGTSTYTGDSPTNWYTNSAFCWGNSCDDASTRTDSENMELSGLWISKFEIVKYDDSTIGSKPNVKAWGFEDISVYFNKINLDLNGDNAINNYGLAENTYDGHMIKNTEWGAASYLKFSKYGKYGNTDYTGLNKIVYGNVNKGLFTGKSVGDDGYDYFYYEVTDACSYNDITDRGNGLGSCGGGSSITGNVSGIYDMHMNFYEFVMVNMVDASGNFNTSYSGFDFVPETKYYNKYDYTSNSSDFSSSINGDAIKEVRDFYVKNNIFMDVKYNDNAWLIRGNSSYDHTGDKGIFSYRGVLGDYDGNNFPSTRFVIVNE